MVPFNVMTTAMIICPSAMAGSACLLSRSKLTEHQLQIIGLYFLLDTNHERPIVSMLAASCHTAAFHASEIQYAT